MTTTGSAAADQPGSRQCGTTDAPTVTYGAKPASPGAGRFRVNSSNVSATGRIEPPSPSGKARPWTTLMPAWTATSSRYSASRVLPTPASPTMTSACPPRSPRSRRTASAMSDAGPSRPTRIGQRTPTPLFRTARLSSPPAGSKQAGHCHHYPTGARRAERLCRVLRPTDERGPQPGVDAVHFEQLVVRADLGDLA